MPDVGCSGHAGHWDVSLKKINCLRGCVCVCGCTYIFTSEIRKERGRRDEEMSVGERKSKYIHDADESFFSFCSVTHQGLNLRQYLGDVDHNLVAVRVTVNQSHLMQMCY